MYYRDYYISLLEKHSCKNEAKRNGICQRIKALPHPLWEEK